MSVIYKILMIIFEENSIEEQETASIDLGLHPQRAIIWMVDFRRIFFGTISHFLDFKPDMSFEEAKTWLAQLVCDSTGGLVQPGAQKPIVCSPNDKDFFEKVTAKLRELTDDLFMTHNAASLLFGHNKEYLTEIEAETQRRMLTPNIFSSVESSMTNIPDGFSAPELTEIERLLIEERIPKENETDESALIRFATHVFAIPANSFSGKFQLGLLKIQALILTQFFANGALKREENPLLWLS